MAFRDSEPVESSGNSAAVAYRDTRNGDAFPPKEQFHHVAVGPFFRLKQFIGGKGTGPDGASVEVEILSILFSTAGTAVKGDMGVPREKDHTSGIIYNLLKDSVSVEVGLASGIGLMGCQRGMTEQQRPEGFRLLPGQQGRKPFQLAVFWKPEPAEMASGIESNDPQLVSGCQIGSAGMLDAMPAQLLGPFQERLLKGRIVRGSLYYPGTGKQRIVMVA